MIIDIIMKDVISTLIIAMIIAPMISGSYTNNNRNWMTNLPGIENKSWAQLKIPGTHNSATSKLSYIYSADTTVDPTMAIMPYLESTFAAYGVNGTLVREVMNPWLTNQDKSIYRQLIDGIRHFDFRICGLGSELYICHGFLGPKIEQVLEPIKAFLNNNPDEFVLLDFNHVYGVSNHSVATQKIRDIIGNDLLIPKGSLAQKLGLLTGRVFVLYQYNNQFFDQSNQVNTYWANKQTIQTLISDLINSQNNRQDPMNKIYVSQMVLTPSLNMIASGLVRGEKSVKELAAKNYWQFPSVIMNMYNETLVNVVNTDYYSNAFVDVIIGLNQ